jgi:hypothetical protein
MRRLWWLLRESVHYLRARAPWWLFPVLLPILVIFLLLVLLVLILHTASLFPIIYPFI